MRESLGVSQGKAGRGQQMRTDRFEESQGALRCRGGSELPGAASARTGVIKAEEGCLQGFTGQMEARGCRPVGLHTEAAPLALHCL